MPQPNGSRRRGPWVQALLCERVDKTDDGRVINIIGVRQHVMLQPTSLSGPQRMPPVAIAFVVVMYFIAGYMRGSHRGQVTVVSPDRQRLQPFAFPVNLGDRDEWTHPIDLDMTIEIDRPGTWWVEVAVDGNVATRVPLEVSYQPPQFHA